MTRESFEDHSANDLGNGAKENGGHCKYMITINSNKNYIHIRNRSIDNNELDEAHPPTIPHPTESTMSLQTTHLEPATAATASTSQSTSATTSRSQTPAGDRRKSGAYDTAPSQGVWEADKERQHKGFLQKVLGNKLTPSFLK
ncbi:hypothetical protein TI39_contig607g00015 [Zymoseptoria brevis]|uniref:Uncharacterized protein n=1 Tax=Zymoseptoria brevis TaxID=1047168 RepID=A0A0F4GH14_9PEZI|nr:hypothetical protein TI39_contig607g00015 [Zymoseptoria brevis]